MQWLRIATHTLRQHVVDDLLALLLVGLLEQQVSLQQDI